MKSFLRRFRVLGIVPQHPTHGEYLVTGSGSWFLKLQNHFDTSSGGGTVPAPPRLKPVDHQYIRTTHVNANPQLEKFDGDLSQVEAVSFCLELLNRLNPCLSLKTYDFRSQNLRDASHVVLPARSGVTP